MIDDNKYENKLILTCYTDGDWGFDLESLPQEKIEKLMEIWKIEIQKEKEGTFEAPYFPDYIPDSTSMLTDNPHCHYCFTYEFRDAFYDLGIKVLKTLQVMLYADTHEWAYEQVGNMLQQGIDFIQSKQEGIHYSTVQDGNWQPTSLIIIRKRIEENKK